MLVGATLVGNSYAIGHNGDDGFNVLSQTDGVLLSVVRPSPIDGRVLALGRSLSSELWELSLPASP